MGLNFMVITHNPTVFPDRCPLIYKDFASKFNNGDFEDEDHIEQASWPLELWFRIPT